MLEYIAYFILFGIVGWVIDTSYRLSTNEKHANTFLPFFGLIYAIGGVLLLAFYHNSDMPAILQIAFGGLLITAVEFVGGVFCLRFLRHRFWNYSLAPYNLFGHVDLTHTLYWFGLAALVKIIAPYLV